MSIFPKPHVGVAFTGDDAAPEVIAEPTVVFWAHNAARRVALGVLLAILCIAAYVSPIINGSVLPADAAAVTRNPTLFMWSDYGTIWFSPQKLQQLTPMAYSVMVPERHFFYELPRGYRIISLLIHIANALLLLRLLNRLELPGAWLGAALFALDPAQVDTVCWISQQRYLICGFFYLCALLVYLRRAGLNPAPPPPLPGTEPLIRIALPESQTTLYVWSMLLFLLALLSHVLAATFPLVVLVMIWWERGTIRRADSTPLILPAALGAILISATIVVDCRHTGAIWSRVHLGNWLIDLGRGFWSDLISILLPIGLSFAHPRWDQIPFAWWQILFPLSAIFVLAALWRLRARWGRGPFASIALFCILLLPSAFGVNDPGGLAGISVQEHQLYLACAAIVAPAAVLIVQWILSRPRPSRMLLRPGVAPILASAIAIGFAIMAGVHSIAYGNSKSLWEQTLRGDGDSIVALNELGKMNLADKDYNDAEQHFEDALRADPTDDQSLFNLAHVAESRGEFDTAIARYDQILRQHPNDPDAHFGLAGDYIDQGNTTDGLAEYHKVLALRPDDANVYNNLGLVYSRQGESDRAIEAYKRAIHLDPSIVAAYLNLANLQFQAGKFQDARDCLERVIKIDPGNYVVWMNAGVMATYVNDLDSAETYFKIAARCNPKNPEAFVDLGTVLMKISALPKKQSRVGEAIGYFKRAMDLDKDDANAQAALDDAERIQAIHAARGQP